MYYKILIIAFTIFAIIAYLYGASTPENITGLVENVIEPAIKNRDGETALHLASRRRNVDLLRILLDKGVDVNIRSTTGMTPLHVAAGDGYLEVTNLLLERGADLNAQESVNGHTPLHCAVLGGHVDAVRMLLGMGADLNIQSNKHETAMMLALMKGRIGAAHIISQRLSVMEAGANSWNTYLHDTAREGLYDSV